LRVAAVSLLVVSLVACGGGRGNPDEAAIKEMVEQFFQAFEDGDSALLASLFGQECGDMTAAAMSAIATFEGQGDIEVDLEDVSIQNLTESSAEYLPQGTVRSEGEEAPLSGPDEPYTAAVKESGVWKIAECELFL
jgi:hypothetical protein